MTVCACEWVPLSQAQTVVQGVNTVTGEEHLREVMEGNRYPDTCSTGLAIAVFTDVSGYLLPSMTSLRVYFSCYCVHILNDSLCL